MPNKNSNSFSLLSVSVIGGLLVGTALLGAIVGSFFASNRGRRQ